jgi:murein DD-endopeptidase / murein LD-carboxypeptidase
MKFTSLLKKTFVAALLGLSLVSVQIAGAGTAHAASSASASVSSAQKADKIVSFAQSMIGKVRYKFGVNNPQSKTFDCSSFTKYVFASQGVQLTWSSRAQSQQGSYVSKSGLKPGDLVFFSVGTPGKVNHVGIYIGNGKFVHNTIGSHVNGVIVSDLSKYSNRYITARRVL